MASSETMDHHTVVVVGGGISGLTAAWFLRDLDVCVLEAADVVGGRLKTEHRGPYWLNLGAHVLTAGGPMARLAADVGADLIEPQGAFLATVAGDRVIQGRGVVEILYRLPLPWSGRLSLLRVGLAMVRGRWADPARLDRMTFAEFLGPMHPDVDALMRVMANRLTGELTEISAYTGVKGFNGLWLRGRLNVAGGSAQLPRALEARLGQRVETRTQVMCVRQTTDKVLVECRRDGVDFRKSADACILAVPAPQARELMADKPDDIDDALSGIRYTPFVVAGLFTSETSAMPWDDIYALAVPRRSFCMLFNPANPLRSKHGARQPGGCLVMYSVAERAAQMLALSDREIADRYLTDLCAIFPQAKGVVSEIVIQRWPQGAVLGCPGWSTHAVRLASGHGRIAFAGDYMMPRDESEASASGRRAAILIRERLANPAARAL